MKDIDINMIGKNIIPKTNSLNQISNECKEDLVIMANAISQSIFGKPVLSLGPRLQQKIVLAVINIIKELKEAKK